MVAAEGEPYLTRDTELEHMKLAIREARRSEPEDERPHPHVGVVVVRGDEVLASACRGDKAPGEHAEYGALEKKLKAEKLAGCTVYTTLEPCTTRNHPKVPCVERLVQRRVARVVIGSLDPDQRITGKGVLRLRRAGIAVDLFPPDLMSEIEELNRDFIRDCESRATASMPAGVFEAGITAFYPSRDYYAIFRRDALTIDRYISTAEHTLVMVSINLMTGLPFNDLCACLQRKLHRPTEKFSATLSLLDPGRRDLMSVTAPILNKDAHELADSIRRSLRDLLHFKQTLDGEARSRLDIRVHPALPFGSAILLDHAHPNGRIQIETKPYKVGVQRSIAFEVARRSDSNILFDVLSTAYGMLLDDGHSVVDDDLAQGSERTVTETGRTA